MAAAVGPGTKAAAPCEREREREIGREKVNNEENEGALNLQLLMKSIIILIWSIITLIPN